MNSIPSIRCSTKSPGSRPTIIMLARSPEACARSRDDGLPPDDRCRLNYTVRGPRCVKERIPTAVPDLHCLFRNLQSSPGLVERGHHAACRLRHVSCASHGPTAKPGRRVVRHAARRRSRYRRRGDVLPPARRPTFSGDVRPDDRLVRGGVAEGLLRQSADLVSSVIMIACLLAPSELGTPCYDENWPCGCAHSAYRAERAHLTFSLN